jgi:hypothetical protein
MCPVEGCEQAFGPLVEEELDDFSSRPLCQHLVKLLQRGATNSARAAFV